MESSGESLDGLPTDANEPLAHMDLGFAQKVFKKGRRDRIDRPLDTPQPSVSLEIVGGAAPDGTSSMTHRLLQNAKLTLLATALFLLLSHPKIDEIIRRFKFDTFTSYAVKGTIFALLFFILKHRFV
jgi:hypothetical protein